MPGSFSGTRDVGMGGIQLTGAPVLLEEEIRFCYVGMLAEHGSEVSTGSRPRCGVGFASMKPGRFVSVDSADEGHVLTRAFWAAVPEFYANAEIACGGELRAAVLDSGGQPIQGCELERALPSVGDSMQHRCEWKDHPDRSALAHGQFD